MTGTSLMAPRAIDSTSHVHNDLRSTDHLVRLEQDHGRQREPEGLRGLEVDHELEPRRLLHGQVRRRGTSQDFVHIGSDLSPSLPHACIIAHETPSFDIRTPLRRPRADAAGPRDQRSVGDRGRKRRPQHEERLGLRTRHCGEGLLERGGIAHVEEVQLHP